MKVKTYGIMYFDGDVVDDNMELFHETTKPSKWFRESDEIHYGIENVTESDDGLAIYLDIDNVEISGEGDESIAHTVEIEFEGDERDEFWQVVTEIVEADAGDSEFLFAQELAAH